MMRSAVARGAITKYCPKRHYPLIVYAFIFRRSTPFDHRKLKRSWRGIYFLFCFCGRRLAGLGVLLLDLSHGQPLVVH